METCAGKRSINLNTATLGSLRPDIRRAIRDFEDSPEHAQFPLAVYTQGRQLKRNSAHLAAEIWNADTAAISSSAGGSEACLRLSWLIQEFFIAEQKRPRVLMSLHEHEGARVPFTSNPSFDSHSIPDSVIHDASRTAELVHEHQADVVLLSEIFYDNCRRVAMQPLFEQLETRGFRGIFLLDAAQSAGNLESLTDIRPFSFPIFETFSLAKWLQGPWGTSATLCNQAARVWLKKHPRKMDAAFDPESPTALLEPTGAQDFAKYAGTRHLLRQLRDKRGADCSTTADRQDFMKRLMSLFEKTGIRTELSGDSKSRSFSTIFETDPRTAWDPYPLYSGLNERGVHIKCIKKSLADGTPFSALRWSLGRHLSQDDLRMALESVAATLKELGKL